MLKLIEPSAPAPLTVKQKEIAGLAPALSFEELFDPELTREDLLARVDPDTLRQAPINLLVSTAIAMSEPDATALVEDHVLRYREALISTEQGAQGYVRLTAEKLVLADVEYQQAIVRYGEVEARYPSREDFASGQIFNEACKLHERRMDRLLRARKECFDRYERAAEVYRVALLTRDGQEVLVSLATKSRGRVAGVPQSPAHSLASGAYEEGRVDVLPAETEQTRDVRVLVQIR